MEDTALGFAEDLGRLLGTAERKANDWIGQRKQVVAQLTELRDKASELLERLGGDPATAVRRRGRPATSTRTASTTAAAAGKRSRMSAAQRQAVSERMRKYWAARRKAAAK